MATVTLKYTKLNSSLGVGDYVFYMTPTNVGSYTVEDSFKGRYLGRVQSIAPPTNPPLVIENVQMPFKNKRTNPVNLGNQTANFNPVQPTLISITKSMNPEWPAAANVGDFIYISLGDGTVLFPNLTVVNPVQSSFSTIFKMEISGSLSSQFSSSTNFNLGFGTTNMISKTINMNDTTGIEVGNTVTGTDIPNGTTVASVVANTLITVNNHLIFKGKLMGQTRDLTFTGTDNFHTIVIEANSNATMPLANDYFYFTKDRSVDSSGVLGYYAEVKMKDTSNIKSELYSVSSEIFESSK